MSTFKVGNLDVIDLRATLPRHPTLCYEVRGIGGIEQLVIHHSATDDDRSAERIAEYHVNTNGWPGIGYHFLVHQDGRIEYTQGIEVTSYGVARRNDNTLHICLVGNWTERQPSEAQLVATRKLIDNLCFALGRIYPVVGHTEIAPPDYATACPGATWTQWKGRLMTEQPAATDWRAEAEAYRVKAERLSSELGTARTRMSLLEDAMRSAARTLSAYVTINK